MKAKVILIFSFIIFLFLPEIFSCVDSNRNDNMHNEKKKAAEEKIKAPSETKNNAAPLDADNCDASLWKHVYNPSRLHIVDSCITVTGVIEESKAEDDGDQHLLLKLDTGQHDLLNKKNVKKKSDNLVLEVVCANHIKDKKAKKACKGYMNNIQLPSVGAHVKVTGSYVIDSHNGWAEIHPVTKMEVIK